MSGRIDDIAVYEKDPRIIWVDYAVGGVFKSVNAGTSFLPVFENYGSASIGDIAVDQTNPNVVWVGTGEQNNPQTSSFGDGIYKTAVALNFLLWHQRTRASFRFGATVSDCVSPLSPSNAAR